MRRYLGLEVLAKSRLTLIKGHNNEPEVLPAAISAQHPQTTDHALPPQTSRPRT
jgi:hypothetical protein